MHMIRLQDSEESGDEEQDYTTTTIDLMTCNMLVDTTVHPDFLIYTEYQCNLYYDQWINSNQEFCYEGIIKTHSISNDYGYILPSP